jgi:hypothetical protein
MIPSLAEITDIGCQIALLKERQNKAIQDKHNYLMNLKSSLKQQLARVELELEELSKQRS